MHSHLRQSQLAYVVSQHMWASASRVAMASPQTAQEALRAWLNLLPPDQRLAAQSVMGAGWPASAKASDEPTPADASAEPTPSPRQADPATTPIPEEPSPVFLAQREWYDGQDKIFRGPIPPETPWQDDDLSAQQSSSASQQAAANEAYTEPTAPDQEPWLSPKPDTCLFNIFGESFELQALKEKIAKGQMPHCLYKDPAAVDQQPLNRQEMWAAMQFKPIYRTAGRWTYWDLLPEDIRQPPPQAASERLLPQRRRASQLLLAGRDPPMTGDRTIRSRPSDSLHGSARPGPGHCLLPRFRALDQPGASTKPYIFDIDLLDRRAQPLFSHPNYKPIECMIFDSRPWICFYGGSPPTVIAESDDWWYTMYAADGSCCLQGWPRLLMQDFADDAASSPSGEDFGTSDARGLTTHAPRTHPPDRLQYRLDETGSLRI
ncbi:unnamed protein product [Symbiodinium sp. KB8]|nr:unnamed protein product [Symbiodinium sp. KB8]